MVNIQMLMMYFACNRTLYFGNTLWPEMTHSETTVMKPSVLYIQITLDIISAFALIYPRAMKTQRPNIHQYHKDILNILSQKISGDFIHTNDRHDIYFIIFNVKSPNVYTLILAHSNCSQISMHYQKLSVCASLAWLQYQRLWNIGYVVGTFRYSYIDILNQIVLSWRRYFMTHGVIESVTRLIFLLYAAFHPLIFILMLSTDKMEYICIYSYTGRKRPSNLPLPPVLK